MKHVLSVIGAVAALSFGGTAHAQVLPGLGDCSTLNGGTECVTLGAYPDGSGGTRQALMLDGIPIAFRYDEYWSYSAPLLQSMVDQGVLDESYGPYNFSTGVGNLDVVIFTQAGGTSNQNVGPSGTNDFEDPYASAAGAGAGPKNDMPLDANDGDDKYYFEAIWGAGDQDKDGFLPGDPGPDSLGPVTVGDTLAYLQEFDPDNAIPVFYVDWNQAGAADSLFANANVQIINPITGDVVGEWSLDTNNNGAWDPLAQTYNYGNISFLGDPVACAGDLWDPISGQGCAGVTDSGLDYAGLSHNKGSGKADFIFYAPDMNLLAYNPDYLFVVTANIGCDVAGLPNPDYDPGASDGPKNREFTTQGCNTNGAEEMFLTGRFAEDYHTVPTSGTLFLTAFGLLLLGWRRGSDVS